MFDVVVIGGGPGGYKTAELLGKQGISVALVEEDALGGVCLNQGCIPFKSYLNVAKLRQKAKKLLKEITEDEFDVKLNQKKILQKKQQIIKGLQQSVSGLLKSSGVIVFYGCARVVESMDKYIRIDVNGELLECKNVVIATGSEEIMFPDIIKEMLPYKVMGSREMLELEDFPKSIDIVGGGVIGLEAACYYADAGCTVTLIEASDHVGGHIDLEIAMVLKRIMQNKGIRIITNTCLKKFEQDGVVYQQNDEFIRRESQCVLIAIGRKPRIDTDMLDCLGVKYDKKGIVIDEHCRTSNPRVYACGDVTGKLMLAHTAYRQAKVIVDSIKEKGSSMDYQIIPRIIYTNPEVLSVGFTEEDCKEQNIRYIAKSLPMTYSGKYFAECGKDGARAKMIVDEAEHRIIGFHMIGNGSSELSLALELMISNKMTTDEIGNMIFAHPTYSEIVGELTNCF